MPITLKMLHRNNYAGLEIGILLGSTKHWCVLRYIRSTWRMSDIYYYEPSRFSLGVNLDLIESLNNEYYSR